MSKFLDSIANGTKLEAYKVKGQEVFLRPLSAKDIIDLGKAKEGESGYLVVERALRDKEGNSLLDTGEGSALADQLGITEFGDLCRKVEEISGLSAEEAEGN